jgi:hypothetical protein
MSPLYRIEPEPLMGRLGASAGHGMHSFEQVHYSRRSAAVGARVKTMTGGPCAPPQARLQAAAARMIVNGCIAKLAAEVLAPVRSTAASSRVPAQLV